MKVSDSRTQWAKIGTISAFSFVGKEAVCFGSGCHLIFVNLSTAEELLYTANNKQFGDGIKCFAGHRTQNIFAYAENSLNPTIYVKTYPDFVSISQLTNGSPENGYLNIAFSETSILVTLGDIPEMMITVWNWRLGEKIAAKESTIRKREQILRCNLSRPVFMVQIALKTTDLNVWDIFLCGKKAILTQHLVLLPENCQIQAFTDCLWTSEGGLFILDSQGAVYTMQIFPNHHLEKVIDFKIISPLEDNLFPTSLTWHKGGIVIAGPNREIRHYKKSGNWSIDWEMFPDSQEPIKKLHASKGDVLIMLSLNYNLIQVIRSQNDFKYFRKLATNFNNFVLLRPTCEYLVILGHSSQLTVVKVESGEELSNFSLNRGKCLTITENPLFPYVAVGYDNGYMELISIMNPGNPAVMATFFLSRNRIDRIYFNDCGRIFVAADTQIGQFFILEGLPGGQIDVMACVEAKFQIADFMLVISKDCYRLFTIPVTDEESLVGDKIVRFCVIKDKETNVKEYKFEDPQALYSKIIATNKMNRDRVFFAIPYRSKRIHMVEIRRGSVNAKIIKEIVTGHQISKVQLQFAKDLALTWSYDGLVILRDSNFSTVHGLGLPHHRMNGGVKKARADPYHKFIISLGYDNVLVCTNLSEHEKSEDLSSELSQLLNSPAYGLLFKRKTYGFLPRGAYQGKCWLEMEEIKKIEVERDKCKSERVAILKEFRVIQAQLHDLLTCNLQGPENERLDISEFNLDTKLYQEKANYQQKLRKATEIYLQNLIVAHNRISQWLIENLLDNMSVPGTAIMAIFANFQVENYALTPPISGLEQNVLWVEEQRKLETYLINSNPFKPWTVIPEEELLEQIEAKPQLPEDNPKINMEEVEGDEEDEEEQQDKLKETRIAFSGSDIQRFLVDSSVTRYEQCEIQSFYQAHLQRISARHEKIKLKQYFNKEFDNMMSQKTKEMNSIKERNARLRYIISEINYFSTDQISILIDDPIWSQMETPELIKEVADYEIVITPYISPSQQALLDAKAAEAERLRLLLLADDFRERALMAMMNGVLELRWEDELKKEVPVPKCVNDKQPENYNEDDLRAVRDYEEKVKFLHSERERYKNLLHAEYARVAHHVRETIRKFNGRLEDLLLLRMKVDSAMILESLMIARQKLGQQKRYKRELVQVKDLMNFITDNEKVMSSVQQLISSLHESINECKSSVESLQNKDKFLEKAFKRDFQDMSPVVQEQSAKLYRKRPKVTLRNVNSGTALQELSKCILSSNVRLTSESGDFLKALDNLDLYVGIPPTIDERTYALICKHRRLKIEYEIKLKAVTTELAEAEVTLGFFQKRLSHKKDRNVKLNAELVQQRSDILLRRYDMEVQIVVPQGLVEVPMSGEICNFNDAALVCRKEVEEINRIILEYGDKKVEAMNQTMNFRRRIITMEWEHMRMRMQIQDLKEKLVDIKAVKVTKDMQAYLKSLKRGKGADVVSFETEVDMMKASYENVIKERKDQVKKFQKQIHAIKEDDRDVDKKIADVNVDVCEFNLVKDHELSAKERAIIDMRMKTLLTRTKLAQEIQERHNEILMLQTELELLRLKTFPTLKYKIFKN